MKSDSPCAVFPDKFYDIRRARRLFVVFYGFTIRFSKQNKTALVGLWYHILFLFWLYLMHRNIRSIQSVLGAIQEEIYEQDLAFSVWQARGVCRQPVHW